MAGSGSDQLGHGQSGSCAEAEVKSVTLMTFLAYFVCNTLALYGRIVSYTYVFMLPHRMASLSWRTLDWPERLGFVYGVTPLR